MGRNLVIIDIPGSGKRYSHIEVKNDNSIEVAANCIIDTVT